MFFPGATLTSEGMKYPFRILGRLQKGTKNIEQILVIRAAVNLKYTIEFGLSCSKQ